MTGLLHHLCVSTLTGCVGEWDGSLMDVSPPGHCLLSLYSSALMLMQRTTHSIAQCCAYGCSVYVLLKTRRQCLMILILDWILLTFCIIQERLAAIIKLSRNCKKFDKFSQSPVLWTSHSFDLKWLVLLHASLVKSRSATNTYYFAFHMLLEV